MQSATPEATHPSAAAVREQSASSEPLLLVIEEECASLFAAVPDTDHQPPPQVLHDLQDLGRGQQMHLVPCAVTPEAVSNVIDQHLSEVAARQGQSAVRSATPHTTSPEGATS